MTYTSFLVHVTPDEARLASLRCAADLADEFGATVLGLGAEALAPLGLPAGGGLEGSEAAWADIETAQIAENLGLAEANFRKVVATRPSAWRTHWAAPTEAMAQMASAADLILVEGGPAAPLDPSRDLELGHLIMTAGRPVLVCPPEAERLSARSALIAWKNTRESRRAVLDALPLLKRAEEVVILEIAGDAELGQETARIADVVAALARHGVSAEPRVAVRRTSSADTLLDHADSMGAPLIVAGGYGHSRIGEWAFGGVTRALLKQDQRFVLFSH